jgi:hypothetical protein
LEIRETWDLKKSRTILQISVNGPLDQNNEANSGIHALFYLFQWVGKLSNRSHLTGSLLITEYISLNIIKQINIQTKALI